MTGYSLAPVADLRARLTAAGIRHAEDPAELTPPGVLVQVIGFDRQTLGATQVATRLLLVAPSSDHHRALAELVDLLNDVSEVADPDGPVTTGTTTLPGDATPLPVLVFPLNLDA